MVFRIAITMINKNLATEQVITKSLRMPEDIYGKMWERLT